MKNYTLYYASFPDMEDVSYSEFTFQAKNDYDALLVALLFEKEYSFKYKAFNGINIDEDDIQDNLSEALEEQEIDSEDFDYDIDSLEQLVGKYVDEMEESMVLVGPTKKYDYTGNYPAIPDIQEFSVKLVY